MQIKELIRGPCDREFNNQAVKEFMGGLRRFAEGVPQAEFENIASGARGTSSELEVRHACIETSGICEEFSNMTKFHCRHLSMKV